LRSTYPPRFREWIAHIQTALPDIDDITVYSRPEDKYKVLTVHYRGGLRVPSWAISDGTLRMLALTILAYLPNFQGIYLIEEPENGVHPRAMETVYQALSNVYDAQILLATHSPVVLGLVSPEQLLCFGKTADGQVDIVRGDVHPALLGWQSGFDLALLHGSGVLG
jgi:predicted ATPase